MEFLLTAISYAALIGVAVSLFSLAFVGGFLKYCDILVGDHYWNKFQSVSWENYVKSREKLAKDSRNFKSDKRLSGSVLIDDELQDFIHLSLRDFVENWYTNISDDKEFMFEARKALGSVFVTISTRCKEVDWLNNFLPKVMDVLAMHIRLYKTPTVNYVHITSAEINDFPGTSTRVPEDFFELETFGSLKTRYTRKKIFEERNFEIDALKVLGDALLWLASPVFEFHNRPLELLISQVLVGGFILPTMESTIDPDYINQIAIWMCSSISSGGDSLMSVLRSSGLFEELEAVVDLLNKELQALRSHDLGGSETNELNKRQISSLVFLKEVIEKRMQNEFQGSNSAESVLISKRSQPTTPYIMSLEEILKNSVSLSYFLDFLSSQDLQGFLLFLLSIEGWKGSVVNESALDFGLAIGAGASDLSKRKHADELSILKEAAQNIVEQYFSSCVTCPIDVDESVIAAIHNKLRLGYLDECLFDEIEQRILEKFTNEERFLSNFYRSDAYLQMLAELGLGKQIPKFEKFSEVDSSAATPKDSTEFDRIAEATNNYESTAFRNYSTSSCVKVIKFPSRPITAHIIDKGVYRDKIGSHIVYTVLVRKLLNGKEVDQWVVHRRYSDFYEFHNRLGQKCKVVCTLPFPSKRAFNNMDQQFLEIRKKRLNEYLDKLTEEDVISTFPELPALLLDFLRKDCEPQKGRILKKMDNFVMPLLSSFKTMSRTMRPNPLGKESQLQALDSRTFQMSPFFISDSDEVALSMEADNMAVRVILFLMDEIFDLRYRNQWLRRSALLMLREILQAMFGDVFDEKINELLASLTSASQLADSIRSVKNKLWPGGVFYYVPAPVRTKSTKMRTRVAAKTMLMSCVSDEIKHLIGNETTRLGIIQTFELFQNPLLNRRLIYLIAETLLTTLFPSNNFSNFFLKLHYIPKES